MSDTQSRNGAEKNRVFTQEIASRPAPKFEVGPVAWMRENLFKTPLDIVLTLIGAVLAVVTVVSLFTWGTTTANWWAIEFNLTQFLIGRYEAAFEWRLVVASIVTTFVCGAAVAIWMRKIARVAFITIVITTLTLLILPPLITTLIPLPRNYLAVAATPVEVGTSSELPAPLIGFIGMAGDTVTLQLADPALIEDDTRLAAIAGFMDATTNLLRNTAAGRLASIAQRDNLQAQLERDRVSAIPLFTESQRAQREAQLNNLQIPEPTVERFGVGAPAVVLQILDRTLEPLSEPVRLEAPGDELSFTLPADGWYVLSRQVADDAEGVALLTGVGIYPILRSTALGEADGRTTGFVSTYIRMTDNFRTTQLIPRQGGDDLPFYNVVNNQYRGSRPFDVYLRVYVASFLTRISTGMLMLMAAGLAGYWAAWLAERAISRKVARRFTVYGLVSLPVVIWVMAAGISPQEILNLLCVSAAVMFILLMYQVGIMLGRTPPAIVIYVVGAGIITALPQWAFGQSYGLGLLSAINMGSFLLAGLSYLAGSSLYGTADERTRRRAIVYGALTVALVVVPLALVFGGVINPSVRYTDWFLANSDQRRWGGLLLTFILTIFGIIVAFPIGVGLALGRRSKLPAIKYGCTAYIELVRGSPFITVLFMMQLMIPLINPAFAEIPGTIRALVAVIMFSAAYLAENVRGGLQSLPPGQEEAARALGMANWQIITQITLPQALRAVIPALVGQFIALFKDTSLVAIVGLTDLTGYVNIMAVQAEFIGTRAEGLLFITIIYFVFSYVMSYVSRLLEASGSGSTRRM